MKMTKRDILEALGIERREDHFMSGLFIGLGAGALIGGVCALLLSPKRGTEWRNVISEKSREVVDKLRRRTGDGGARDTEFGTEGGYKPSV